MYQHKTSNKPERNKVIPHEKSKWTIMAAFENTAASKMKRPTNSFGKK